MAPEVSTLGTLQLQASANGHAGLLSIAFPIDMGMDKELCVSLGLPPLTSQGRVDLPKSDSDRDGVLQRILVRLLLCYPRTAEIWNLYHQCLRVRMQLTFGLLIFTST